MSVRTVAPILRVSDANRSIEWYERIGFACEGTHTFGPGFPVYAFLAAGDQAIHLSEHEGDAQGETLLYIYVDDIEAVASEFETEITEQPWAREVQLKDPDGNRLRLGERKR